MMSGPCEGLSIVMPRTTEQYETLGEQDKPNAYEQIKNKQGKQSNITQSRLQKLSLSVRLTVDCIVVVVNVVVFKITLSK
jgi:hypothetical protein